jgi:hypothetical protein
LRAYCLAALVSLNEAVCQVELTKLLSSPSAETRYGAFRSLYILDEHNRDIQGELLNDSFWLHRIAPQSPSLVHVSQSKRAEIVLFGQEAVMVPPFYLLVGPEFTATASPQDKRCTVSRFDPQHGDKQYRQCSLNVEDILRTMADMGAIYSDAVALLTQADKYQCMSCKVRVDALPTVYPAEELARNATNPEFFKEFPDQDQEISQAAGNEGPAPAVQTGDTMANREAARR